jgi:hypothetical protein
MHRVLKGPPMRASYSYSYSCQIAWGVAWGLLLLVPHLQARALEESKAVMLCYVK